MGNKESSSSSTQSAQKGQKTSKMFHFALLGSESSDTSRILRDIQYECQVSGARRPDYTHYIVAIRKFAVSSIWKLYCGSQETMLRDEALNIDAYSIDAAALKLIQFALDRFAHSSWLKNKTSLKQLAECVQYLWRLPPIQQCWRLDHASDVSMQHFLTQIERVMSEQFQPTRQDVMLLPYASLSELSLCLNRIHLNVVAVKQQYSRKILHSLSDITGIIYVASLSEFDVYSGTGSTRQNNMLLNSIESFGDITSDAILKKIPVVLVLDQFDTFRHKVLNGSSIQQIFHNFVGVTDAEKNVQHSLSYIQQKFLERMRRSCSQHRGLYVHVTSEYGNDLQEIADIFNNVQHMHVTKNLNSNGIF
eukprot:CAMPEP_0202699584 /NCGR_PEP_ID=MMETSP1385-20130828/12806_1 /ASSEMBLY_ACC=CAM_ASM_000861 /TAXON_ID=933848 /ORGANISM="Elphidium margaritaceum" /LENGTH=362 /DNA_ID=CAMNT_0049356561 /DNA_START=51 /DNA_END=1139 /DNA_ORIENTATION=-